MTDKDRITEANILWWNEYARACRRAPWELTDQEAIQWATNEADRKREEFLQARKEERDA